MARNLLFKALTEIGDTRARPRRGQRDAGRGGVALEERWQAEAAG